MKLFFLIFFFKFSYLQAHHKIYSPKVEEGRQSFEWRGHFDVDDRNEENKTIITFLRLNILGQVSGKVNWNFIFLIGRYSAGLGKTEFQNQVQIFDFENFAAALYFSYNFVTEGSEGDEIEYKYLNELYNDKLGLITNFIFENKSEVEPGDQQLSI